MIPRHRRQGSSASPKPSHAREQLEEALKDRIAGGRGVISDDAREDAQPGGGVERTGQRAARTRPRGQRAGGSATAPPNRRRTTSSSSSNRIRKTSSSSSSLTGRSNKCSSANSWSSLSGGDEQQEVQRELGDVLQRQRSRPARRARAAPATRPASSPSRPAELAEDQAAAA